MSNRIVGELELTAAIEALKEQSPKRKFIETINLDTILNLKENQKKDSVKGSYELPNTFGEEKRVIVLCDEAAAKEALAAGAVKAGLDDLVKELNEGFSDFDVVVATPAVMPKIAALGKVLGPKGLMPNPKNGTVTTDVKSAVESFKGGKANFKMEPKQGVIRAGVAKIDMSTDQINANILAFLKAVHTETKKYGANPFKKVIMSTTMGPSVKVSISDIIAQLN